jgi:hypothetical protein
MELPTARSAAEGNRLRATSSNGQPPSHSNPFKPELLITFAWHSGDVPRGIIADIIEDLGLAKDAFYLKKF